MGIEYVVLFTKDGDILKRTCAKEKAERIVDATLALLGTFEETIAKKYESRLKPLQSIRARGTDQYLYILIGTPVIMVFIQRAPISDEEKRIFESVQKIEEFF